jgi:hypothetical protein
MVPRAARADRGWRGVKARWVNGECTTPIGVRTTDFIGECAARFGGIDQNFAQAGAKS